MKSKILSAVMALCAIFTTNSTLNAQEIEAKVTIESVIFNDINAVKVVMTYPSGQTWRLKRSLDLLGNWENISTSMPGYLSRVVGPNNLTVYFQTDGFDKQFFRGESVDLP